MGRESQRFYFSDHAIRRFDGTLNSRFDGGKQPGKFAIMDGRGVDGRLAVMGKQQRLSIAVCFDGAGNGHLLCFEGNVSHVCVFSSSANWGRFL